jgi:hypothetical protein
MDEEFGRVWRKMFVVVVVVVVVVLVVRRPADSIGGFDSRKAVCDEE